MAVFQKYRRDTRGNIALMSALMILPLIALCGGAIDVARIMMNDQKLRNAVESGVLAAASLTNTLDIEDVIDEYINANLPDGAFRDSIVVSVPSKEVALNSRTIEVTATGTIDTYFIGLLGFQDVEITARATAAQSSTNVEIALVMDISSSMAGSKLSDLKSSAKSFVEQMLEDDSLDTTSISLIPFGGTVNIGEDLFNDYATTLAASIVDPTEAQYTQNQSVPNYAFRFTDGDYCLEHRNEDYDQGDVLPSTSRAQVPVVWKWSNFNPWCPPEESATMFNSNDLSALKSHIDGMLLSDGTGMNIGALWGLYALSPDWSGKLGGDFLDRPAVYDENTLKVFIVMTDGEITAQFRPKDYTTFSTHSQSLPLREPEQSSTGTVGILAINKNKNQQTILPKGNLSNSISKYAAIPQFRRVCAEAKNSGAIVFTIGFRIKKDATSDQLLAECATNIGMYYFVEDTDLKAAFDSIAASVSALRIVG